jgi:hypothetical protein
VPDERDELAPRDLRTPSTARLPVDTAGRDAIIAAHDAALASGDAGYLDPATGLFVLTAAFHARRGTCCHNGCRHCPYVAG